MDEPEYNGEPIGGLIERCKSEGITHFEYSLEKDDDSWNEWHWDVWAKDPHKWFYIPKPWTITFLWLGFKSNPNKLFGFLPFSIYFSDRWNFTYYDDNEIMGCQYYACRDTSKQSIEEGLFWALKSFTYDPSKDDVDETDNC